jgi:hypothetical protein
MPDKNDEKKDSEFINQMFKKLSREKKERVRGYLEGIAAHSEQNNKSA